MREKASYDRKEKITKTYETYKEYKWFTYLSYFISGSILLMLAASIGYACYIGGSMVNWPIVGDWTIFIFGIIIGLVILIFVIYAIVKYIFGPLINWISCVKLPHCGICENMKNFFSYFKYIFIPFKYILIGIWKLIAIIGNMIYSTYKKQCPVITWEDKKVV